MNANVVAMLLVGGKGQRLYPITKHKAKPAVTFGGKYKLIDFVLSNISNAGILSVGIITQYQPHELMAYVEHGASWDLDITDGGVQFLTPFSDDKGDNWQKGTAHAIRQHMHYVQQKDADIVLVLSGDHVYKMDYGALINAHIKQGADVTIGAFEPHDDLSRYGVINTEEHRVVGFEEKPQNPNGTLASMGIYVFNKTTIESILSEGLEAGFDFGKDIIPKALQEGYNLHAYRFDGYFRDVGTIESLFQANMDLIDHPEFLRLTDYKQLPLYTKSSHYPPHHIDVNVSLNDALISDGCYIQGDIKRSIISPNVRVGFESIVEDSLVFAHVKIGDHCRIKNAIILENTVVMKNTNIVFDKPTVIDNDTLWALGDESDG